MLKRKIKLREVTNRRCVMRLPVIVFLIIIGTLCISQVWFAGSRNENLEINRASFARFGLMELFNASEGIKNTTKVGLTINSSDEFSTLSAGSEGSVNVINRSFGRRISAKNFHSVTIDDRNVKWFVTESGIVSYDGRRWTLHDRNPQLPGTDIRQIEYLHTSSGRKLWLANPGGASLASIPLGRRDAVNTYNTDNSPLLSNNVTSVAVGSNSVSWIGTERGISAIRDNKWLDQAYMDLYPIEMFESHPITALATSNDGDSLYAATIGLGVLRVYRDEVDAITGASDYAPWGPIYMPSYDVYSICITPDGTQWFGTDNGIARHIGFNTLANWTVFDTDDGLIHNFVQAIAVDKDDKMWFGTKGGVSVYDGSTWTSYTENDGLKSNNILCIAVDRDGVVWLGTDNGVTSFSNGTFSNFN